MVKQYFELLSALHDEALEYTRFLKFDINQLRSKLLVSLYCSLIEYTGSNIVIVAQARSISLPVIFRAFFEGYVDFYNLYTDEDYLKFIEIKNLMERRKMLKKMLRSEKSDSNPFLQSIATPEALEEEINSLTKQIEALKEEDYKKLRISEQCEKAGFKNEYEAIYAQLCDYAHNSPDALQGRHLVIENKNRFRLALYEPSAPEVIIKILDANTAMLLNASIKIHGFFQSSYETVFKQFEQKLTTLRSSS